MGRLLAIIVFTACLGAGLAMANDKQAALAAWTELRQAYNEQKFDKATAGLSGESRAEIERRHRLAREAKEDELRKADGFDQLMVLLTRDCHSAMLKYLHPLETIVGTRRECGAVIMPDVFSLRFSDDRNLLQRNDEMIFYGGVTILLFRKENNGWKWDLVHDYFNQARVEFKEAFAASHKIQDDFIVAAFADIKQKPLSTQWNPPQ
jgi:hypothetical protein